MIQRYGIKDQKRIRKQKLSEKSVNKVFFACPAYEGLTKMLMTSRGRKVRISSIPFLNNHQLFLKHNKETKKQNNPDHLDNAQQLFICK